MLSRCFCGFPCPCACTDVHSVRFPEHLNIGVASGFFDDASVRNTLHRKNHALPEFCCSSFRNYLEVSCTIGSKVEDVFSDELLAIWFLLCQRLLYLLSVVF